MKKEKDISIEQLKSELKTQEAAPTPVSKDALVQRLERRLLKTGMKLHGGRGQSDKVALVWQEKGQWHKADTDLEELARKLGVLKPWEALQQ